MGEKSESRPEFLTADVKLNISGRQMQLQITVPTAPTPPAKLLPLFRSMADTIVGFAIEDMNAAGLQISCKAGCGACCRQLVPISKTEAHRLREVVSEMPEERQTEIISRFQAAREKLQSAGLLERLEAREFTNKQEAAAIGMEYFAQDIYCPFLEEGSCSIYSERPISCREYLVTSPAENCSKPSAETVRCVPMPGRVSNSLTPLGANPQGKSAPWVPLILALDWAESHPNEPAPQPGTDIVKEVFGRLAQQKIEGPENQA